MASAKKCDRCGVLYEVYDGIPMSKGGQCYNTMLVANNSISRNYDMCPECMTKLKDFLTELEGDKANEQP